MPICARANGRCSRRPARAHQHRRGRPPDRAGKDLPGAWGVVPRRRRVRRLRGADRARQEMARRDRTRRLGIGAYDRHPDIRDQPWLGRRKVDASELRSLPLFASLTDVELSLVSRSARQERAAEGEEIVRRWDPSREFYVLLEGTAEVRAAEKHRAGLGPGDFFGELAALDWGASFGYPRLASVVATSPVRLLVLPDGRFNTLVRDVSAFGERIRQAVRERDRK